jgi:hypothetical protein
MRYLVEFGPCSPRRYRRAPDFVSGDQTYTVTQAVYEDLKAAALIVDCDDCSAELSGRLVAHPNVGKVHQARVHIRSAIAAANRARR